jgi:hypothetical protein
MNPPPKWAKPIDDAPACGCGWPLPDTCVPVDIDGRELAGGEYVNLRCPVCGRGHSFLTPEAAQRQGLMSLGTPGGDA